MAAPMPVLGPDGIAEFRITSALVSLRNFAPAGPQPHTLAIGRRTMQSAAQLRRHICVRGASSVSAAASDGQAVSAAEVERRLVKAASLIATSQKLVAFDPAAVNLALVIWWARSGCSWRRRCPQSTALLVLALTCAAPALCECRQAIRDIPAQHRVDLVPRLSSA